MDLGVPNILYQNKITIQYKDGNSHHLFGELMIYNLNGWEPFKRVVTYEKDGMTVKSDECLSACGQYIMP